MFSQAFRTVSKRFPTFPWLVLPRAPRSPLLCASGERTRRRTFFGNSLPGSRVKRNRREALSGRSFVGTSRLDGRPYNAFGTHVIPPGLHLQHVRKHVVPPDCIYKARGQPGLKLHHVRRPAGICKAALRVMRPCGPPARAIVPYHSHGHVELQSFGRFCSWRNLLATSGGDEA